MPAPSACWRRRFAEPGIRPRAAISTPPLKLPVYAGAQFGHIRRKFTLPVGLDVEVDAQAGTVRFLSAAVV